MSPINYLLDITWDASALRGLPRFVGPFGTAAAAGEWAVLNIPNGTWQVWPVTAP